MPSIDGTLSRGPPVSVVISARHHRRRRDRPDLDAGRPWSATPGSFEVVGGDGPPSSSAASRAAVGGFGSLSGRHATPAVCDRLSSVGERFS